MYQYGEDSLSQRNPSRNLHWPTVPTVCYGTANEGTRKLSDGDMGLSHRRVQRFVLQLVIDRLGSFVDDGRETPTRLGGDRRYFLQRHQPAA